MSVAIENVWTLVGIKILIDRLKKVHLVTSIKAIWLFCELKENHRRDELRIPDSQMKERVDVVHNELMDYAWPEYLHKVDSTDLSIEQTISKINILGSI